MARRTIELAEEGRRVTSYAILLILVFALAGTESLTVGASNSAQVQSLARAQQLGSFGAGLGPVASPANPSLSPLPSAVIQAYDQADLSTVLNSTLPDTNGGYGIEFVSSSAGPFIINASREGFISSGHLSAVQAGGKTTGADITLWRSAIITGRVVDPSGRPIAGILVQALSASGFAGYDITGSDGIYAIETGLGNSNYTLYLSYVAGSIFYSSLLSNLGEATQVYPSYLPGYLPATVKTPVVANGTKMRL